MFAANDYRADGGDDFPHLAAAQLLWSNSDEIRHTMIAWVKAKGSLDPAAFASLDWKLTRNGTPVFWRLSRLLEVQE